MSGALDGVTVVDFSQFVQGPYATRRLADMGADVVKVEPPGGDANRDIPACGRLLRGEGPFALALNRNKRSVVLDLKTGAGREVARDLVREADVLVENFRPGVMERFGLGYEDVRELVPDIVYASATGFGRDGPYADRPGQDLLVQSLSGMAAATGTADGGPTPCGVTVVDVLAGQSLSFAIVVALYHRALTGEGQRVDANLLDTALDAQCQELTAALNLDVPWSRSDAGLASVHAQAPYGVYETRDGHAAIASTPLSTLVDVLGIDPDDLPPHDDPRTAFEHREEIHAVVERHTRERRTDELVEQLLAADAWAAEVNEYDDLPADPQVEHNEMLVDLEHPAGGTFTTTGVPTSLSETPGEIDAPPPAAGEHSEEVLAELGYDREEIASLRAEGVVAGPEAARD